MSVPTMGVDLDEAVAWMRSRGCHYTQQPLCVTWAVYNAHKAREDGMLRAMRTMEAHATRAAHNTRLESMLAEVTEAK